MLTLNCNAKKFQDKIAQIKDVTISKNLAPQFTDVEITQFVEATRSKNSCPNN